MDSTNCEQGDRSVLSLISVTNDKILQFAFYTNFESNDFDAQLMVGVFCTQEGLITDSLLTIEKTDHITSVSAADCVTRMHPRKPSVNGWKYDAILLRWGTYYVGIEGKCGLPYESNITVDDILVWTAQPNDKLLDGNTMLGSLEGLPSFLAELPVGESKIFFFSFYFRFK